MDYDAIVGREGCEPESGNEWYGLLPFTELCVWPHDKESEIFTQPATVSYSIGPDQRGNQTKPYFTSWAVWVGTIGVRVGQADHVDPPANDLGENSSLYLKVKPEELTHAWNGKGDLAIAIQKDKDNIELKQYVDDAGTIATYAWRGRSPVLYYSGHVLHGDPSEGQLVCYYLHPEMPRVLYARFESEGFATERIVMPALRLGLAQLINVVTIEDALIGGKVALYALSVRGRDVTLTTAEHIPTFAESAFLGIGFGDLNGDPGEDGGVYHVTIDTPEILVVDQAKIDIKVDGGTIIKPLIDYDTTPTVESTSLSVALVGGEIT